MLPMKPSNRQPSPSEQTLQFPARYTLKYCFFLTHLYTRWHRALLAMLVKLYFFKPTVLRHIKATWRSQWFESFSLRCLKKGCSLCGPLISVVTICKSPILWEKTNRTEVDTFWSDLLFNTVRMSFDHDPGDSEANNQAKGKKLAVSVQRESWHDLDHRG